MQALLQHLLSRWPGFRAFIRSHVLRLAVQGRLRQAYRRKLRTIADHHRRIQIYQKAALTEINRSRIRSFEREIERLMIERDIIKETMDYLGIPL